MPASDDDDDAALLAVVVREVRRCMAPQPRVATPPRGLFRRAPLRIAEAALVRPTEAVAMVYWCVVLPLLPPVGFEPN